MVRGRWLVTICWLAVVVLPGVAVAEDVLHMKLGAPIRGEIDLITDSVVRVKVVIRRGGATGSATRSLPLSLVRFIDFAPLEGEESALADPAKSGAGALGALWDAKMTNLGRANSNAGVVGLALADLLLASEGGPACERALRLYSKIELEDWDPKRASLASRGRLRALIALGKATEVMAEAQAIANETDDLELLQDAQFVLYTADSEELQSRIGENPKWREDDEVRAEIGALYNRVLDQFLTPYLFNGAEPEGAARGLWLACETYQSGGESERAAECAGDILKLYGESPFAGKARGFLDANRTQHDGDNKDEK
jgi:hypothetical protein